MVPLGWFFTNEIQPLIGMLVDSFTVSWSYCFTVSLNKVDGKYQWNSEAMEQYSFSYQLALNSILYILPDQLIYPRQWPVGPSLGMKCQHHLIR